MMDDDNSCPSPKGGFWFLFFSSISLYYNELLPTSYLITHSSPPNPLSLFSLASERRREFEGIPLLGGFYFISTTTSCLPLGVYFISTMTTTPAPFLGVVILFYFDDDVCPPLPPGGVLFYNYDACPSFFHFTYIYPLVLTLFLHEEGYVCFDLLQYDTVDYSSKSKY